MMTDFLFGCDVQKSKGTLAVSNRRQEWSIMQDKIYPELEEVRRVFQVVCDRN